MQQEGAETFTSVLSQQQGKCNNALALCFLHFCALAARHYLLAPCDLRLAATYPLPAIC